MSPRAASTSRASRTSSSDRPLAYRSVGTSKARPIAAAAASTCASTPSTRARRSDRTARTPAGQRVARRSPVGSGGVAIADARYSGRPSDASHSASTDQRCRESAARTNVSTSSRASRPRRKTASAARSSASSASSRASPASSSSRHVEHHEGRPARRDAGGGKPVRRSCPRRPTGRRRPPGRRAVGPASAAVSASAIAARSRVWTVEASAASAARREPGGATPGTIRASSAVTPPPSASMRPACSLSARASSSAPTIGPYAIRARPRTQTS